MAKIDAINQKIIAQSVQTRTNQADVPKKIEETEKKESVSDKSKNYKVATAAVASIAIANGATIPPIITAAITPEPPDAISAVASVEVPKR